MTTLGADMGYEFKSGDLLESKMQALVNTVNCVGVMGKGIALGFKNAYPDMYTDYVRRCKRNAVQLGQPYLYPEPHLNLSLPLAETSGNLEVAHPKIINFPTKKHWRSGSKIEDVKSGLRFLADRIPEWGIESLAIPPLGCGNGGLDWCEVGPVIQTFAESLDLPVEIYVPPGVDPTSPFSLCEP